MPGDGPATFVIETIKSFVPDLGYLFSICMVRPHWDFLTHHFDSVDAVPGPTNNQALGSGSLLPECAPILCCLDERSTWWWA